jgi:hypothetical protein
MPEVKHHARPFGVTEQELLKVEAFCAANKLDEIGRICAELRLLRTEYLLLSKRIGLQAAHVPMDSIQANLRFGESLNTITKQEG